MDVINYFNYSFSSAHFYHQKAWNDQKNREVFGACFDPFGHGHDYQVHIGFNGPVKSSDVSEQLKSIIAELDHHHLNHQIPEFSKLIPTTENIALYLGARIREKVSAYPLRKIRLYEMGSLASEVWFD